MSKRFLGNFKALYIYENKEIENFNLDYCMNLLRNTEVNEKIRLRILKYKREMLK